MKKKRFTEQQIAFALRQAEQGASMMVLIAAIITSTPRLGGA
jgi:hypothetical protein